MCGYGRADASITCLRVGGTQHGFVLLLHPVCSGQKLMQLLAQARKQLSIGTHILLARPEIGHIIQLLDIPYTLTGSSRNKHLYPAL